MTEEQIDRIIDAMDEACKPLGCERFEDVGADAEWLRSVLSAAVEVLPHFRNRKTLREWLRSFPPDDPSPAEVERIAPFFVNFLYEIRKTAPEFIKKEIPHPPGGRPAIALDTAILPPKR